MGHIVYRMVSNTLPTTYTVTENNDKPALYLGAPVAQSLEVEQGDTIVAVENENGVLVKKADL